MQDIILVKDNFYATPKALAIVARSLDYSEREHDGHKYNGVGTGYEPELAALHLSQLHGKRVSLGLNFFRLGTADDNATTHIHSDNTIGAFAAVLYINDAPPGVQAGTAFWRHKKYGLEAMPTADWIISNVGPDVAAFIKEINDDGNDESKWDMVSLVGQKANRLVTYPTHYFHSRYPQNAWGKDKTDGRLIWAGFYHLID